MYVFEYIELLNMQYAVHKPVFPIRFISILLICYNL